MSLLAFFVMFVVIGAPGFHLLMLWRRTRLAPEGLLTIFFLGFAVGVPIRLFYATNPEIGGWTRELLSGLSTTSLVGAVLALASFIRVVFRSDSRAAVLYFRITAGVLAACILFLIVSGEISNQMHPVTMIATSWSIPIFWWGFVECAHQYRQMGRQARVGIGDPLVRNRFLLWSLWTGAFALLPTAGISLKSYLLAITPAGQQVHAPATLLAVMQGLVLVSACVACLSIWLSFFPPASYGARFSNEGEQPDEA